MIKVILMVVFMLFFTGCSQDTPVTRTELIFDTPVTISIYENKKDDILQEAFDICKTYEEQFSKNISTSEVSLLNNANSKTLEVSDELIEILEYSYEFSEKTDGMFDVTVYPLMELWDFTSLTPSLPTIEDIELAQQKIGYENIIIEGNTVTLLGETQIDLGAIAKGYIANKVRDYLISENIEKAIIDIGGNIVTVGTKSKYEGFIIGIRKPFGETNEISAAIEVIDMSVVTSGPYERSFVVDDVLYHHIIDPNTGYPVETDMVSATIVAKDPFTADALSTSCFLLGVDKAVELIESLEDTEAIFIEADGDIILTSGIGDTIPITYY